MMLTELLGCLVGVVGCAIAVARGVFAVCESFDVEGDA